MIDQSETKNGGRYVSQDSSTLYEETEGSH
jgi:hypothetical protein